MAAAYASVKVTSVYLGPEGIGVFSQFHYITSMVLGMAAGSTNTAVVRLMGEYAGDPDRIRVLLGTIARTLAAVGAVISLSFVALSPWIAERMLDGSQWVVFVMLFGLSYLAGLMHCFLLAVANGSKDYRTITITNISCIVVNLLLIVVVCPIYGLTGALAVAALSPLFMAALAYFWAFRRTWMPHRVLRSGFSRLELRKFLAIIPMTLAFGVVPGTTEIWVRDFLAQHHGWAQVGFVQGMTRLSEMYMGVIATVLTMYYLPRFAEVRTAPQMRHELLRGFSIILPAVAVLSTGLYLTRDLLIHLIFTAEFLPMRDLFGWQMAGTVIRAIPLFLGYVLIAKAPPMKMVVFELAQAGFLVGAAHLFVPAHAGVGVTQALLASATFSAVTHMAWVILMVRQMPRHVDPVGLVAASDVNPGVAPAKGR